MKIRSQHVILVIVALLLIPIVPSIGFAEQVDKLERLGKSLDTKTRELIKKSDKETLEKSLPCIKSNDCDGDGSLSNKDCNDYDPSAYPGAPVVLCDNVDNDCDGYVEDFDCDGDYSIAAGGTDCDDYDATTYPGATEICDFADNDCNNIVDDNCVP